MTYASENARLHRLLSHVKACPNSQAHYSLYFSLVRTRGRRSAVLELGCARGLDLYSIATNSECRVAHGIDLAARDISFANIYNGTDRLRFFHHDINMEWQGKYDLIFGKGILHHVNWQAALARFYDSNLNAGGSMVFMEPLGNSLPLRLYWKFGQRFHDPHERPFTASDIFWIAQKFKYFEYYVCNYVSLPLGIISSLFSQRPDNAVMRAADRADRLLASKWPSLKPKFRSAIFVIEKKL